MLVLTVLQGPGKGRRYELPEGRRHVIGRSSESVPIADPTVSRRHAELIPEEGGWCIADLGGGNGTFVNGSRVVGRHPLQPGDQVRTGSTLFVIGQGGKDRKRGVRVGSRQEINAHVEAMIVGDVESVIMATPERGRAAILQLKLIYRLTELIGATDDRQELLERVMDLVFKHFKPDRGFILLQNAPTERPEPVVIRHHEGPEHQTSDGWITVSRKIVRHVMRHGEGVLSSNVMTDPRFSGGQPSGGDNVRSAICVPIKFKDRLFGVIHVDSRIVNRAYTQDQLRLLTVIGAQTGLALANLQSRDARVERERFAAVGETVASLSHSVRNILQGLRGGAEVVEMGLRRENLNLMRGGWEIVSRNLDRIYHLTMNMLAFSKQRRPEPQTTNLLKLLEELASLVQGQYDSKRVSLVTELDPNMPTVLLDADGIHQAVLNLLNNALEVVPPVTGSVKLRCFYDDQADTVKIAVADNGPGIPPEVQKRLFEPFYSTKGLRGTGLGLVVTKKIVEEHGGRVAVESQPGRGATFTLVLPAKGAPPIPILLEPIPEHSTKPAVLLPPTPRKPPSPTSS